TQQRTRERLLDRNPFGWLINRDRSLKISLFVLVLATLGLAFWMAQVVVRRKLGPFMAVAVYSTFAMHLLIKCLVAAEACHRFNQDKRSGAFELILCTPLKIKAVVRAQSGNILRLFLVP